MTELAAVFDVVSVALSKGLGCPVGSLIAGRRDDISRALRARRMFGGAMRQSGLLAAAALYALDHNIQRLVEDQQNARRLAEALAGLPGVRLDPASVESNIVIFELDPASGTASDLVGRLEQRGVRMMATAPNKIRAVTHLDVSREQIETVERLRHAGPGIVAQCLICPVLDFEETSPSREAFADDRHVALVKITERSGRWAAGEARLNQPSCISALLYRHLRHTWQRLGILLK